MNKSELIAEVALKAELTKKDADAAVNAVIDSITESLKKGDKVQLVGFGTFEVRARGGQLLQLLRLVVDDKDGRVRVEGREQLVRRQAGVGELFVA